MHLYMYTDISLCMHTVEIYLHFFFKEASFGIRPAKTH